MEIRKIGSNEKNIEQKKSIIERFLFDEEDGKIRLRILMGLEIDQESFISMKELSEYGSRAKTTPGVTRAFNKIFVNGMLPLKASLYSDGICIRKTEKFNIENYSQADREILSETTQNALIARIYELDIGKNKDNKKIKRRNSSQNKHVKIHN